MRLHDPYRHDPYHRRGVYSPLPIRDHDPRACFNGKRKGLRDGTHYAFVTALGPLVLIMLLAYFFTKH